MDPPVDARLGGDRRELLFETLSVPTVQQLMWVRSESGGRFALRFPRYDHVKFVAVLRGRFDLQIEEEVPSRLRRGDCYMLTDGRPYRIFNADIAEQDAAALYAADRAADGVVRWGDGPIDTVTIGARATFSPSGSECLRQILPPFVRIPAGAAEAGPFRALLTLLCGEVEAAPGASFATDRYVGLLLVEALRYLLRSG